MKRIEKLVLSIAAAFLCGWSASATTLSPDAALARMKTTTTKSMLKASKSLSNLDAAVALKPAHTIIKKDAPAIYIFNNGENAGYVILSADDVAAPVLGYVDEGSFDADDIAPGLAYYLESMADEISAASARRRAPYSVSVERPYREPIGPLCSTQWNQASPYNMLCPRINGQPAMTGCVATAMAQLMKYHKWPERGTGSIKYNDIYNNDYSANFENSEYAWSDMLDTYNSSATSDQELAVALLMRDCGYSLEMNYSISSSSTPSTYVPRVLKTYFGYSEDTRMADRSYYTLLQWEELIYNQFNDYGPVLLSGQNAKGAHAFICDGYKSDGYFHINWGWGGKSDGYFLLSTLTPSEQGIGGTDQGYPGGQDAVINAKIEDGKRGTTPTLSCTTSLTFDSAPHTLGTNLRAKSLVDNLIGDNAPFIGYWAYEITNESGEVVTYWANKYSNSSFPLSFGGTTWPNADSSADDPGDGTYYIEVVYSAKRSGPWEHVHYLADKSPKAKMVIENGEATFTTLQVDNTLEVSDLTLTTLLGTGSLPVAFTATVTNVGTSEYYGYIYLKALKEFDTATTPGKNGDEYYMTLLPGESIDINYTSDFNLPEAGVYKFAFYTYNNEMIGDQWLYETAQETSSGTLSHTLSFVDGNTESVNALDIRINADITCSGGYFYGAPKLNIFPRYSSTGVVQGIGSLTTSPFSLNDGESKTVLYQGAVENASSNTDHFAQLYLNGKAIGDRLYFTTANEYSGVESVENGNGAELRLIDNTLFVEANADIARVEIRTITGSTVAACSPNAKTAAIGIDAPRGIYLAVVTLADGTSKAAKIVAGR